MNALDTSIVVPALLSWHEAHDHARAVAGGNVIPAHVALEAYSVLTRLPTPHRLSREVAQELLDDWFSREAVLTLPAGGQRSLVQRLAAAGISGGASYDGLIGLTAAHHEVVLLTRDGRAAHTYRALGIEHRLLEP